jgi:hypothetical protein
MKNPSRCHAFGTSCRISFLCAVAVLLLASAASAARITYTGFTIADGQLGAWQFHNAQVYLTFESDTSHVQLTQIQGVDVAYIGPFPAQQLCTGPASPIGTARVSIISGEKRVRATFAPNQLFVSLDLDNGGVGFGSCGPNGLEPAYPLGIQDGTIDGATASFGLPGADGQNLSADLLSLSFDLMHDTGFSGRAWVCVGYPNRACPAPTQALQTDKGGLYLFQPYTLPGLDTLSGGFFWAVVGGDDDSIAASSDSEEGYSEPAAAIAESEESKPITYTAFVISDVEIGGNLYFGAQVYLSFEADTATAVPFPNARCGLLPNGICGYINERGEARVRVTSGGRTITARFAPHQLYVYFDIANSSVGFGSYAGGRGYPLSITKHDLGAQGLPCGFGDGCTLTENSLVGAVADIIATGDSRNYSAETAALSSDLKSDTTVSGPASSCVSFDPTTSICSNLTPIPLQTTDQGSFLLFEPYTDDESTTNVPQPFSVNWGAFWAER